MKKTISYALILATLVWAGSLAFLVEPAFATVTPTVTSLITTARTAKASSAAIAAIKVAFTADGGELLAALTVVATDSASTSFNPATDLAALDAATEANSGIALYNDAGATAGSFDGTDAVVPMATESAWSSGSSTLTLTTPAAAGTYFLVFKTASAATNGHGFVLTIPANGIATTLNSPTITAVSTSAITIDTAAPTLNTSLSGPSNGATGVPISTFIHMTFSENLDQTTLIPANITLTAGTAQNGAIRPFPNGFDFVLSSPPAYATSSRFAKANTVSTGFFQIMGTNPISPQGAYTSPTQGDIVISQRESFPPEVGLVTDATLTSGTFALNGFPVFGSTQITKFATPAATGLVSAGTALTAGDIVVVNTTANPTDMRYNWHIVTTGAAVNNAALRLDGATGGQPSFVSGSRFSKITPAATATDNGATTDGTLAVSVGDLVFVKIGSSYGWHLVTTAGNLSSDATENTAFIDDGAADPAIVASSQMSKLTPAAQAAVTDTATVFAVGDMVFASTTANASNNGAYNFHMVTNGATGATGTALRFDNASSSLLTSTAYTLTMTTSIKDSAGNPLADNQGVTFTTGSTGGTNTTPPFVQSSQPQSGSQNHPISAPIRLTFSVDMAASGSGSIIADANIGLFTDVNGAPGSAITTAKAYDSATKTVTLTPSSALTASTAYVAKVNITATSTTGTALTQPYFLFFRTPSGAADTAAPTVLGVSPATGSTGVSMSTVVTAGFSEDIDPSTISATTVTLAKTTPLTAVTGNVSYSPQSRSANFTPSTALEANTGYTFTIVGGASGVNDLSGNDLASNFTSTFTTTNTVDNVLPKVAFAAADDFGVAVTFNETMKTGGGPNAADNIANYSLESPTGSSISLGGKTVTYDSATKTARITGLSLQNGNTFKVTVNAPTQDLAGNGMDTTGTPANNTAFGTVQNSTTTGGNLGPGSGTINFSTQGMNPTRVTPMNRAAGATSNYKAEFLAATSVPSGGKIVLTFPAGFTVTNADDVAVASSFCNADMNGPATGATTIASIANDNAAGTITITTGGDATGANAFLCLDLSGIVNSTVPNSAGYTVDIKTRDTALNNLAILETKTASPFFLGSTGSNTLTVHVFKDANSDNVKDSGEGVGSVTVYLYSPATGGQEATTTTGASGGVATFSNLANGDYMVGLKPTAAIDVAFNSAPQPITISGDFTKKFALSNAAAITISGTVYGPAATQLDVFANSPTGFAKTTVTTNSTPVTVNSVSYGGSVAYSLPVLANTTYNVGVGPAIPESFFTPGSAPPPPPTFTFMPPSPLTVVVAAASVPNQNFTLAATNKTIAGTVVDSSAGGISNAGVFCRPTESSTGTSSGFGTGGQTNTSGAFTLNVTPGVYLCGVFKPGMPSAPEKQITVPSTGTNTPASLAFVIDVATTLTVSGTVKDDSGNAIPYAGVSGRKVTSTTNTTPLGGDSGNFAGGPTDANGAYTLYVTTGTWVVEAFAPGFGKLGTKTVTVSSSSLSGQDFSAQTLSIGTITGTATKATVAQQGVMVRADGTNGGNMAVTDSTGFYTLKVPAGSYTVTCFFPGVGESTPLTNVTVTSGGTTPTQNCTLAAPITITVNVTDGTNPITNAGVEARDSNGRGNFTSTSTSTGANAVYTLVVPPGTYTVRAGHPAYGSLGTTAAVSTTSTITYNVGSSKQLYAVTGSVTGDTVALSGAWVSLNGTPTGATNTVFLGAQTIANGTFTINVPPGSYRIRADKPGYKSPAETAVTVVDQAVAAGAIALTTAARTITGTVTLDNAGVSNAFVDATDGNGGYAVAQTNTSGAYTLNVDNGTWTIRAHSQGYEGGPLPVTVNNDSPSGQTITLSAISGFTLTAEKPETVTPSNGGFIGNSDIGTHFQLEIPANALGTGSNAATVTTKVNTAMPNPPTGTILNKNAVTIDAVDASGQPIASLNDDVTITIPYTEADLPAGTSESSLVIGVWNDATQTYDTLSTTVDTTLDTLTATVSHLSDFAPLVSSGGSPPDTPTGLAATNTGTGTTVSLSWTAMSGAATYNVYKSTNGGSTFPFLAASSTTSYTPTGLDPNTSVQFKVSSVNSTGDESAASSAVTITPTATGGGGGGGGGAVTTPTPTPTPTPEVTPTPTPTSSPTPSPVANAAPAGAHPNGTLVLDGKTVFLIKDGKRVGFRNSQEYVSHGYNFGQAVAANAQDKALPQAEFVQKALEGSLVLDADDNRTIWMIGTNGTKRGFATLKALRDLGYSTAGIRRMFVSDYPEGPAIISGSETHPDGALVLDGKTVWWVLGSSRSGFESEAVFKTYGFSFRSVVKANISDLALSEGSLVKFRDGTLVKDGADYYLISDGKKLKFASVADLAAKGYKSANAISASLAGKYDDGGTVQ